MRKTTLTLLLLFIAMAGLHAQAILRVNLSQTEVSPDETGFTNWLQPVDPVTPGPVSTTINGYGLSATGTVSDVAGNGFRSIDRTATYAGTLANLTETWWGVRAATSSTGGTFTLGITGLAAGSCNWTSWHHDHGNQKGIMNIAVSVNGGSSFTNVVTNLKVADGISASAPNPATFGFTANGTGQVLVRFTNTSLDGTGSSGTFAVVNGFQIEPAAPPHGFPELATQIHDNGVWTWFNDERAIWHLGKLYAGYVDSTGFPGIVRYDPVTKISSNTVLGSDAAQQIDDHNNPSITVLPDGKLLVLYSRHNTQRVYYWRQSLVTEPDDISDWGAEQVSPDQGRGVTYNNTFRLSGESNRIYNFSRITNFNPCVSYSDNNGSTWTGPIHFIDTGTNGNRRHYPQTVSNGVDRIDMIYTEGHPDSINCSVYHFYYKGAGGSPGGGSIFLSDGSVLNAGSDPKTFADIAAGDPIDHDGDQSGTGGVERGTVVYQYRATPYAGSDDADDYLPGGRAWTWDVDYQTNGDPVCVFQVQLPSVVGSGTSYLNDRIYYYYARWTGTGWEKRLIAQGGAPDLQ